MSEHLEQYVQYMRNTGRPQQLEISQFDEDWEPIGPFIRHDLRSAGLTIEEDGYLILRESEVPHG